jgi:V/A-type H+-transporting ATPase subunit A
MSEARIKWASGPVLRARTEGAFSMREAVEVGDARLLGEVIRIEGQEIVVQVYEDTTGLKPGVPVRGTGQPLSVPLGPGLIGGIFDGLLRPLTDTGTPYVSPGARPAPPRQFEFEARVRAGERVAPGAVYGNVNGGEDRRHALLVPPDGEGEVVKVAEPGTYDEDASLLVVRASDGAAREIAMRALWPVRAPRPVRERLSANEPLVTGQRVIDSLFPVARGGRAAIPGGFGTGKTILLETLAKWCNADVIVYVGCGERGNEIAGVLEEFPQLEDPRTQRPLMERTVIIANTSNMPVSAREASIYTGITVAEYFRDQGLHVALMADSTSRWAEALREVSGRLGELPGEGAYPAYLSSRLAEFYERAGRVRTLAGEEGSVTVIGAVSPPSADFSEPVTSHTKRYIRSLWTLDTKRAQARFYPAIHPLQSYAEDVATLGSWWQRQGNEHWPALRRQFLTLIEDEARLERMARIIGKDALPPRQQLVLFCAELVNEGFLRQSAFSEADRYCSPARQTAMMNVLARFIDLAERALQSGAAFDAIAGVPVLRHLTRMGEELGESELDKYKALEEEVERAFSNLKAADAG